MSCSKPLSYDSLRTVLMYFPTKLRIYLASQVPRLRLTEKAVPLKLENLKITSSRLEIDGAIYQLGTLLFSPTETGFKPVCSWEIYPKTGCDVDKFGFRLPYPKPTPGELDFDESSLARNGGQIPEEIVLNNFKYYENNKFAPQDPRFHNNRDYLGQLKSQLDMYRCRRENLDFPYKHFLCFSYSGNLEVLEYSSNFGMALKYMIKKLLGGRDEIFVKNLEIAAEDRIFIPIDLKFKVENLKIRNAGKCLNSLKPFLSNSNFSKIQVSYLETDDEEVLSKAQIVNVEFVRNLETLSSCKLDRVHFSTLKTREQQLVQIVRDWQRHGRKIGTFWSFKFEYRHIKQYSKHCEQQEGVEVLGGAGERYTHYIPTFIFPINAYSEIRVDFATDGTPRSEKGRVEIRVQPRKSDLEKASKAKILSKNCLKAILENMKLGVRLLLAQKLPDIKTIEKETSLKIEYLSVSPSSICIEGDAKYNLLLEKCDKIGDRFSRPNWCVRHDVDKYGIKIPWGPLSPGDLDFGRSNEEEETEDESKLENLKNELAALENGEVDQNENEIPIQHRILIQKRKIEREEWKAKKFRLRKEQKEPDYKFFLDFSITISYTSRKTEKMEYSENQSFDQAVRYMMMKVFGERTAPIFVKNLALETDFGSGRDILRFPESLKMNVQHLTVKGNKNGLEILKPIFTGMESIGVDQILQKDLEFLKGIQKIVIFDRVTESENLQCLPDKKNLIFTFFKEDLILRILRNWRKIELASGRKYLFGGKVYEMENILENISKIEGADVKEMTKKRGPFIHPIVTVPINELMEIKISMFEAKRFWYGMLELSEHHVFMEQRAFSWLKMEVQPKSSLM